MATFFLSLLVVWALGVGVGLRMGWMLWNRPDPETCDQRREVTIYERPRNVIVLTDARARVIYGRLVSGKSVATVAREYAMPQHEVERIYDAVVAATRTPA
ncbi:MAG TPA: hypothetical protein VJS88_02275, partial [Chthoniobacterales bacterium]|nr:hypothetical protein [Chthoniobacterales bacterium]